MFSLNVGNLLPFEDYRLSRNSFQPILPYDPNLLQLLAANAGVKMNYSYDWLMNPLAKIYNPVKRVQDALSVAYANEVLIAKEKARNLLKVQAGQLLSLANAQLFEPQRGVYIAANPAKENSLVNLSPDAKKKRFRRPADKIERYFKCPAADCNKAYGSEGSLYQHIKIKHPAFNIKSITDIYHVSKMNKKKADEQAINLDPTSPLNEEEEFRKKQKFSAESDLSDANQASDSVSTNVENLSVQSE